MSKTPATPPPTENQETYADGTTRRDFVMLTAGALGAVGAASVAWPFIDSIENTWRAPSK